MKRITLIAALIGLFTLTSFETRKSYPCHALGDLYPCTHAQHVGDVGPCGHTYWLNGVLYTQHVTDLYPCTHPVHSAGDLGPCTHVCW